LPRSKQYFFLNTTPNQYKNSDLPKSQSLLKSPAQSGLPGPKKLKRPNLAISSFKKGQILKNEKRPNKGQISLKKLLK
jgi:hypothetical protein